MVHGGYAVIDVETTGLWPGRHHRVIEIGIVHLDVHGEVEASFETVVDPSRDLGPIHVHGLRSADVRGAPRFEHIVDELCDRLRGRVVVAHNARFEAQFLAAEFARLGLVSPLGPDGAGALCTMKLAPTYLPGSGRTLADCCAALDVDLSVAHESLADATATARLLSAYLRMGDAQSGWWQDWGRYAALQQWPTAQTPRTTPHPGFAGGAGGADDGGHGPGRAAWRSRRRVARVPELAPDPSAGAEPRFLERATELLPRLDLGRRQDQYAAMLDKALSHGYLSTAEGGNLTTLATELDLDGSARAVLHDRYFASLVSTVWAHDVLSDDERRQVDAVAEMLGIAPHRRDAALVPSVLERAPRPADDDELDEFEVIEGLNESLGAASEPRTPTLARPDVGPLAPGAHVALTGSLSQGRDALARTLERAGLVVWPAVTTETSLVVAADVACPSGKVRKALHYGVPVVDETQLPFVLARSRRSRTAA
jgi:DNA polymerase III epsilon subunit family exonuclease